MGSRGKGPRVAAKYRTLSGAALPPFAAWLAFTRSCGYEVMHPGAFRRRVEAGRGQGDKAAVLRKIDTGETVYRLISWSTSEGFAMRALAEGTAKKVRLSQIKNSARKKR